MAEEQTQAPEAPLEGGDQEAPKNQREDKIAESLENLKYQVAQQNVESTLLQDPDVRRLVELKRSGKDVRVGEAEETPAPPEVPEIDGPLAELSGDQLSEHLSKTIEAKLGQTLPALIKASMSGVQADVTSLMDWAKGQQSTNVQSEGASLRKKYSDFMDFKDQMLALDGEVKNTLSLEDLYLLAKSRAGSPVQPNHQMNSERPTMTPPVSRVSRKEPEGDKNGSGKPQRKLTGRQQFKKLFETLEIEAPQRM